MQTPAKLLQTAHFTVLLVVLFSLVVRFSDFAVVDDLDRIIQKERIRVITTGDELGFVAKSDTVYGFQYELMKAFAQSIGVELVVVVENDLYKAIEMLTKAKVDLIASFIPVSGVVSNRVLLTEPLQVNRHMLVQSTKDSSELIRKQYELAGQVISLPNNAAEYLLVKHLSDQIADSVYVSGVKNATVSSLVKQVAEGKIKFTLCSERYAKRLQTRYPMLSFSLPMSFQQAYAWAVAPEAVLLQAKLNEFLADYIGSQAYWDIYRKYY